jgi:mannitol 2-dehydrogenase
MFMADPDVSNWLRRLIRTEVIPMVPAIPGIDFEDYLETCIRRFGNSAVADTVSRLCLDGSNRQPKFIIPTILDALDAGRPIDGLSLEVALWCRYCAATADTDMDLLLEDERKLLLQKAAVASQEKPSVFLSISEIFGDLGENEIFVSAFSRHLNALWSKGPRSVLQDFLKEEGV